MVRREDGLVVPFVALCRADVADAAAAMIEVVPMHEIGRPVPVVFEVGEAFGQELGPVFGRAEERLGEGVVVPVERGNANAIRPLIRRLVERQIPFAFVPVGHPSGGEVYRAVADRLRHLRLLVTTNPDADYGAEDLAALAASGVARTGRTELRDEQLGALQWTQAAPSNQNLRIVPRARPDDPDRLVLHVVDDSRGEPGAADPQCRRRLGISRSGLGPGEIAAVSVSSLGAGADVRIEPRTEAGYVYVTIEGCALWSIVELKMRR